MEREQWLERMHGDIKQEEYPYEFDTAVLETIPQAKTTLEKSELWHDPLGSIRTCAAMMDFMAEMDEDMGFSNVVNMLVLIEEAEARGHSEEEIMTALYGDETDK